MGQFFMGHVYLAFGCAANRVFNSPFQFAKDAGGSVVNPSHQTSVSPRSF